MWILRIQISALVPVKQVLYLLSHMPPPPPPPRVLSDTELWPSAFHLEKYVDGAETDRLGREGKERTWQVSFPSSTTPTQNMFLVI